MKLTSLTAADFKRIQKLLIQKEKLAAQISKVDSMLEQFESGTAPRAKGKGKRKRAAQAGPARRRRRSSRGGRGQLKDKIIAALKDSGGASMHIKEVAAKVNNKEGNVRTWFFTTGKKIKNIKRSGPAKYRWKD
jgi:hypothetical protein